MTRRYKASYTTLDLERFQELRSILIGFTGSVSAAARAMDISRKTFERWEDTPPKQWYWNTVITEYLMSQLPELTARASSKKQKKLIRLKVRLRKVINDQSFLDDLEYNEAEYRRAQIHVCRILVENDYTIYWDSLITPAYSGGYTPPVLRRAAQSMGMKFTTEGFGSDKRTLISWLEEDVDYPEAQGNEVDTRQRKNRKLR